MEETKQFLFPPTPPMQIKLPTITNGREAITIQEFNVYNFKFRG